MAAAAQGTDWIYCVDEQVLPRYYAEKNGNFVALSDGDERVPYGLGLSCYWEDLKGRNLRLLSNSRTAGAD